MEGSFSLRDLKETLQLIEELRQRQNASELKVLISKFVKLFTSGKMEEIDIDLDYSSIVSHADIPQRSYKCKERYHEEEKGLLIVRDIGADVGDIYSVYLLSSGRFIVVRTADKRCIDEHGATYWDWRGSVEKGDDLAQVLSAKDMNKVLAMLEDALSKKLEEKLDEFLPNIGHGEVGWVVRLLLWGGHFWSIYDSVRNLHRLYKREVVDHLISATKERHSTTSGTAIQVLGEIGEVEPLIQVLGEVDANRRKLILTELNKNSKKALILLLKGHKQAILAGKDATVLEEAINAINVLPPDLVEPLIEAIENGEVSLSFTFSILGELGARGNQRAIEYLTQVYLKDKNRAPKELAGKQLDKLGKRPKSWFEKLFR